MTGSRNKYLLAALAVAAIVVIVAAMRTAHASSAETMVPDNPSNPMLYEYNRFLEHVGRPPAPTI